MLIANNRFNAKVPKAQRNMQSVKKNSKSLVSCSDANLTKIKKFLRVQSHKQSPKPKETMEKFEERKTAPVYRSKIILQPKLKKKRPAQLKAKKASKLKILKANSKEAFSKLSEDKGEFSDIDLDEGVCVPQILKKTSKFASFSRKYAPS